MHLDNCVPMQGKPDRSLLANALSEHSVSQSDRCSRVVNETSGVIAGHAQMHHQQTRLTSMCLPMLFMDAGVQAEIDHTRG